MQRYIKHVDMKSEIHQLYREGANEPAFKLVRALMKAVVKPTSEDVYRMYESSVVGSGGHKELFDVLVETGYVIDVIGRALVGKLEIVPELLYALGRVEADKQEIVILAARERAKVFA